VAESAGCQWWWSQADRSGQRYVQWTGHEEPAPEAGNSAETLRLIDAEAIELGRSMSRDRHLPAGTGTAGPWWSFPFPGLISTTRRVGSLGAVRWRAVRTDSVRPRPSCGRLCSPKTPASSR
jgi:hypothetical protein